MFEVGAGRDFESKNSGQDKKRDPNRGWRQKPPKKNPGKPNPPSQRGHGADK